MQRSVNKGKACGADCLAAEHFIYADERINIIDLFYLIVLFPMDFMKTAIIPIIKYKTGDASDKNNYRPIALVTACSKKITSAFCPLLEIIFVHMIISLVLRSSTGLSCIIPAKTVLYKHVF